MSDPPERRVAAVLLHQVGCSRAGDPRWPGQLARVAIGAMAHVSRQHTRRVLRDLAARGRIEHAYRGIEIRATEPLRGLADGG